MNQSIYLPALLRLTILSLSEAHDCGCSRGRIYVCREELRIEWSHCDIRCLVDDNDCGLSGLLLWYKEAFNGKEREWIVYKLLVEVRFRTVADADAIIGEEKDLMQCAGTLIDWDGGGGGGSSSSLLVFCAGRRSQVGLLWMDEWMDEGWKGTQLTL